MRAILVLAAALCLAFPVLADSARISHGPRELGRVILRELSVKDGQIVIRVDSNGCTQKSSFRIAAKKDSAGSAGVPHYRLSIERIAADECKAMEWDGVNVEFDLAKDAGLSGDYTITMENPVAATPAPASFSAAGDAGGLRAPLLAATVRAIDMEMDAARARLKTGELKARLGELQDERAKYARMRPEDYPAPAREEADAAAAFDRAAESGPVIPPVTREVVGSLEEKPRDGVLITVEGASRSGPFYHLAGITGGEYGALAKGKKYQFTLCLVYKRPYFSFIPDYYVCILNAR
jgi:hypothetical protein